MRGRLLVAAMVALSGLTAPAAAQFSDSYNFLKSVRDADGSKATDALNKLGGIVNTRDQTTGDTALHIVVKRRDGTWLPFLLGKGAKPDIRDRSGNTPLMVAAQLGWVEGVELLARMNGGINTANDAGETPLIAAVQRRDLAMTRVLLAGGANPAQTDRIAGKSARDYAGEDPRAAPLLRLLDQAKPKAPMQGPKP